MNIKYRDEGLEGIRKRLDEHVCRYTRRLDTNKHYNHRIVLFANKDITMSKDGVRLVDALDSLNSAHSHFVGFSADKYKEEIPGKTYLSIIVGYMDTIENPDELIRNETGTGYADFIDWFCGGRVIYGHAKREVR